MTRELDPAIVEATARRIGEMLLANTDEFNLLDAQTGDGDMGTSLAAVANELMADIAPPQGDLGATFNRLAALIAKRSGSSLSALAMTGLMSLGRSMNGRTTATAAEFTSAMREALAVMQSRSGAQFGDKTVLDGLKAMLDSAGEPVDFAILRQRIEVAIAECVEKFRDRPTSAGRARLAPNRSVGLDDPGMIVLLRAVQSL
jgi:hypothetical protein